VTDPLDEVTRLLAFAGQTGPDELAAVAMRAAPLLGADAIIVYVVDYAQTTLVPLNASATPHRDPLPVEGTLAGRVYTTMRVSEPTADGSHHIWVPLCQGARRLGVLKVVISDGRSHRRAALSATAAILADLLTARGAYGDALELARRRLPMPPATEIVWGLLPPLDFANDEVAISGILEPCYEVGGDVFDYAINKDLTHLALFDALGHGISASMLSTLAINAYRNARRCGLDLADTYQSIDKWVRAQFPGSFLTAILATFNSSTGQYQRISAGHPAELLLREGRLVKRLTTPSALPLGLADLTDRPPRIIEEALQPGDHLLLHTDGVVEARSESGEFFGHDRLADFVSRSLADQLPVAETLRKLVRAILDHQHEALQDDATAVTLHWPGPPR
jgi:hypothetical protein